MRPEVGIDLIAQVKDGSFWRYNANIIQIKKEMSLTKNLVFLSITERNKHFLNFHRLVCISKLKL